MSDRGTDAAQESYQRDQAEGERNDEMETKVTRGQGGSPDESTRQQSVAERDQAEGSPAEAEQ